MTLVRRAQPGGKRRRVDPRATRLNYYEPSEHSIGDRQLLLVLHRELSVREPAHVRVRPPTPRSK